ncbi:hypothetical protein BRADI_2g09520v3 [Brachypodium distachyon]|uniref:Uncharacterized protein n=1 Tax=Brachypodium distachyon TaxID=15368 RepID=A0A0Q3ICW8_BRADI|nr:hypothetical protein BRADI_2g09520v3 [Brachypodium distachyon]
MIKTVIGFFCSVNMGANCCIAAKQRPEPCATPVEVSSYRNIRQSPSWSFRWDNRTHIEDIMEIPTNFSNHSSGSIRPETKSGSIAPTEGFSNGGSPSDLFHKVKWHKSEKKMGTSKIAQFDPRDRSTASNSSPEAKLCRKSLDMVSVASDTKTSMSVPSTPPIVSRADPSSSTGHSLPMDPDSMRKARRSPGYQLYRQVSDSKIPSLRSLNESSSPEGRPSSSMLSVCSNDLSAAGSHGGRGSFVCVMAIIAPGIKDQTTHKTVGKKFVALFAHCLLAAVRFVVLCVADGWSTTTPVAEVL